MPFPILGSNSTIAEYEIDNSYRGSNSGYLSRTPSSAGNRQTFTISTWVKISNISHAFPIYNVGTGAGDDTKFEFRFAGSGTLFIAGGATSYRQTNALFRDPSAWYHVVMAFDSTNGTADDRIKLWVNGVQQTSWATNNTVTLNQNTPVNNTSDAHNLGTDGSASTDFFEGYFAEFHLIDGQAKAETDFGKYNDNGVWIPKAYSGTYGTNGFFLEFQDSANLGDDTSGNTNDYTSTNNTAEDQTTDTPTNNFATMNPLGQGSGTTAEGNCEETTDDNNGIPSTFAVANGKWYWEVKIIAGSNNLLGVGDADHYAELATSSTYLNYRINLYGADGRVFNAGSTTQGADAGREFTTNDIISMRLDLDSATKTIKWYKNDSLLTSENLNGVDSNFVLFTPLSTKGGASQTCSYNFGNPAFTISSGNSDANGYGNFEYAVPSGHYSLCSKNLAEYG